MNRQAKLFEVIMSERRRSLCSLCREALKKKPMKFNRLDKSLAELEKRLKLPMEKWVKKSRILEWYRRQTRITHFLTKH